MIKTKKQMYVVIGVFALVMLLGTVTYAFFNYTRTGLANTISTGQINFSTTQTSGQDGYINLTNVFPVDVSSGVPTNDPNVGSVTINVTGDTTYTGGIEYVVTAENVQNTIGSGANAVTVPIGISVTATSGLGTSDDDYFTDVRNNPQTSIYKVLATDVIEEDEQLVVGYIKSGQDGVNGDITIKAYLDASKIAISDTYYENVTTTPTPTAPNDEYGTPASFGEGRTVLTTTQWNALQSGGVSFQVKVEANEGVWVENPGAIASCPGCKFLYRSDIYFYLGDTIETIEEDNNTTITLSDDYHDVITSTRKHFWGLKIDENTNSVEKAYVCGIKGEDPNNGTAFCFEGKPSDDSNQDTDDDYGVLRAANHNFLNTIYGNCVYTENPYHQTSCTGAVEASAYDNGGAYIIQGDNYCYIDYEGYLGCAEE